jgi:dolichol-phosphate mannosyltransferase
MLLSVLIPAQDEERTITATVEALHGHLVKEGVDHELLVVDDHSRDRTAEMLSGLVTRVPTLRVLSNSGPAGYGHAVRAGLEVFSGDAVAIVMADGSDSPADLVTFFRTMTRERVDCVFGSRFGPDGRTIGYPRAKLVLNRAANRAIRIVFGLRYDDITNAFKLYSREAIAGMQPLVSQHFNLTVEMPLKAIVRGYSYVVVPNAWTNRKEDKSKFRIHEIGSRYALVILYCLAERRLSRGGVPRQVLHKPQEAAPSKPSG